MAISKTLLLKGLGACSACVGGVALMAHGGIFGSRSPISIDKGGLVCDGDNGVACSIKANEKLLVKKEGNNGSFEVTALGEGSIRAYKVEGDEYSEGFKFSIEGSDINGSTAGNKLEEFETYEIKLGADDEGETLKGKHYLSRKTDVKTGIKNALGLSCDLPTNGEPKECDITNEGIKTIRFAGGEPTLTGTIKLAIAKDTTGNDYTLGYKFSFKNTETADVTLTIGGDTISLKKDSPVDFKIKKEGSSLSLEKAWSLEELTQKVGLKKEGDGEDLWTIEDSGLNISQDSTKKTKKTKANGSSGKIKLHRDQGGFNHGFKFSIEDGDVKLNGDNGTPIILGQFQSYEIVKDNDGNWYLSRKEGDQTKIKDVLGLPCDLPTNGTPKVCNLSTSNISTIKFDGTETPSITGTAKLTIHKESERTDFPLGYRFSFSSDSNSTITISSSSSNTLALKQNLSIDYKIKRSGTDNSTLTLEKAWTAESLMKKVGFGDKSNEAWTVGSTAVSIKQDTNKSKNITQSGNSNTSKIKVYGGEPGYNQGFKFVIEEADANLSGDSKINKLTKYETYEVVKDGGEWYFSRKKTSSDSIREALGLPETCRIPTSTTSTISCTLDSEKLNLVKFDGRGNTGSVNITDGTGFISLSIGHGDTSEFPLTYKFTFSSTQQHGFTIPQNGSSSISIKKGTNTEFKIKESNGSLTLERAWDAAKLGKKLGLTCNGSGENSCTFDSTISVFESQTSYVDGASITNSSGKSLKYELEQENHNQGIKFYVEGEDIGLSTDSASGSSTKPTKICKKTGDDGGTGTTYEIAEKTVGGQKKWYLVKKSS